MEFSGFSAVRNLDYRNGILRGVQETDTAQKVFFALVEGTKEESRRCKDGRKTPQACKGMKFLENV